MFKFLKDKLKKAVNKFTKTAEKEIIEEKVEDKKIIEEIKAKEHKDFVTEIPDTEEAIKYREQNEKVISKKPENIKKIKVEQKPEIKSQIKKKVKEDNKKKIEESKEEIGEPTKEKTEIEEKSTLKEELEKIKIEYSDKKRTVEPKVISKKKIIPKEKIIVDKTEQIKKDFPNNINTKSSKEKDSITENQHKSFFSKISETFTKKQLSSEKFDELFWELELSMLENNVAVEVIEKIKNDLKEALTTGKVSRGGIDKLIINSLKESLEELFIEPFDLVESIKDNKKRPFVIAFIGVNGSGKTTTLAKIANLFQENDLSVVMAASDTFRAAAIDQLKEHADNLSIKMISQGYNADPAAVAYDAVEYAKAKNVDVVMIDTAGRLHSNTNLMAELEKVIRVSKPDLKIFIGESITGNDCVEQATEFNKLVGIDAIILSKADVDEKGGAAISVSYVTGKPIIYLGVGQAYGDLIKFDKEKIIKSMGL